MASGAIELGRLAALRPFPALGAPMGLRAVVLLAGSVRESELSRGVGRSLLDLPIAAGQNILAHWHAHVERLATRLGQATLPLRVVINRKGHAPGVGPNSARFPLTIEQDRSEYRGTGGVLRDLTESYEESDRILVASAAQVLTEPLDDLAADLVAADDDVALMAHEDGTPSGLFVVRCGALTDIRSGGFVDFKEQVLPRLASEGQSIRVLRRDLPGAIPVRTLDGYMAAVRAIARLAACRPMAHDPFEEDWAPTFSLVEGGAAVSPGATIHDSVVLAGGTVGGGAVVVRSVVCPGGSVRPGMTVADQIVTPGMREQKGPRP
ncbi:MAG: hypothetical protein WD749_02375 [Phycisphaerales bacterium]